MPIFRARISLRSGLIACFLLTCFFTANFAAAANFTLEQVLSSPFPTGLVAASHSPRVAWVFNAKGMRNLWVADAPDFAARQITHYDSDDGLPIASLRITARVVNLSSGDAVADAKVDGRLADVFTLQDGIVSTFARAMGIPGAGRPPVRETSSLDAFRAYTEGWMKIESLDTDLVHASIADFERAIRADSGFAMAYTGLANAQFVAHEPRGNDVLRERTLEICNCTGDEQLRIPWIVERVRQHAARRFLLEQLTPLARVQRAKRTERENSDRGSRRSPRLLPVV